MKTENEIASLHTKRFVIGIIILATIFAVLSLLDLYRCHQYLKQINNVNNKQNMVR